MAGGGGGAGGAFGATGMQNPAFASYLEPCTHGSGVTATGTHRPVFGSDVWSMPHTAYRSDAGVAVGSALTRCTLSRGGNVATTPSTAMYVSASQKGILKVRVQPEGFNSVK